MQTIKKHEISTDIASGGHHEQGFQKYAEKSNFRKKKP